MDDLRSHLPPLIVHNDVRDNLAVEYAEAWKYPIFKTTFATLSDESQQFLDIGCGTGDFTQKWILPSCEPCKRIVAVDASASMLKFAKEKYAHERIVYDYLDIDEDVTEFSKKYGSFQRVYSFKTLHWSRDLRSSLAGIAQLLVPGGECLLFFHARSFLFESFKELSRLEPWSRYAGVRVAVLRRSSTISLFPLSSYYLH
ncbi:juvenile hormone acid O-methyltransferase-like [Rhipicephalus sanguineus]|uniref:juvenile hormone acid O-methyltransferase-like n=1 Tax=Rhipicephalus sanguineus TaxID=34632 RepID=UPI0020C21933|nr:juvenile hormone acid O-methyltransferase-like [Rhipicephalus sanguineus]